MSQIPNFKPAPYRNPANLHNTAASQRVPRDEILASIRGQSFQISDLEKVFRGWPVQQSPHLDWLREEADTWIRKTAALYRAVSDPEKTMKQMKALDIAVYVANAYAEASKEIMRIMMIAIVWMFMWDDTVDHVSAKLGTEFDAAQKFRQATLRYMRTSLLLTEEEHVVPDDLLISSFSDIAKPLLKCSQSSRQEFYNYTAHVIALTEVEQTRRMHRYLPDVLEYIPTRIHTVGMPACHALHMALEGYAIKRVPELRPKLEDLVNGGSIITAITNDILSLKKEVRDGTVDSLVPILWQESRGLQGAVHRAISLMRDYRRQFDEDQRLAYEICPVGLHEDLQKFIRSVQIAAVGNLTWSLQASRYGVAGTKKDGQHEITI